MRKPSAKKIILEFLHGRLQYGNNEISSHHFEKELPEWGIRYWDVKHNPSTYSRIWRILKSGDGLKAIDVDKVEIKKTHSKERTWILRRSILN